MEIQNPATIKVAGFFCVLTVVRQADEHSIYVIFLPGNLLDADGLQKINDVLAPVVMWLAIGVLRHQDDGHVREKACEFAAESRCAAWPMNA